MTNLALEFGMGILSWGLGIFYINKLLHISVPPYPCSEGLYAVQEGYIDVQEGCILFWAVICCSSGLYTVQGGYMVVQEGYMLKKILMFSVATNVIASQLPECRLDGTPTACAN